MKSISPARAGIRKNLEPRIYRSLLLVQNYIRARKVERMIDLGCGNGIFTLLFKDTLEIDDVYGVDINNDALSKAEKRGIKTFKLNLDEDKIPFPDEYFDLIISFEIIEHLLNPDNMLKEANRVLKRGGTILISTPNLASWVNRICLLLGYQPYNVEVSTSIIVGVPYKREVFENPTGHKSAFTLKALREILEHYNYRVVKYYGAPGVYPKNKLFKLLDKFFSLRCSLSRRLIILAIRAQ